jgi:starch synthase
MVPYVKTGGLADVTGSLTNEFCKMGVDTSVILPFYRKIKKNTRNHGITPLGKKIVVPLGDRLQTGELWKGKTSQGATVYFIDNDTFYDRDELYGTPTGDFPDNISRFTFYDRAVCETVKALGIKVDIVHCNDWQTGLIPIYAKTLYKTTFAKTATLLTLHNLGYQGIFWSMDMPVTGLGWELFSVDGLEFYNKINVLKGGILFADILTTVSSNYAKEILSDKYGFGLEGVLRQRSNDLYGVINGINYDDWGPEHNKFIPSHYSVRDISGKATCKKLLQKESGLPVSKSMLIGMVSRLSSQKGIDLIVEVMENILKLGIEMIILGKGEESFHKALLKLQKKFSKQLSVTIGFNDMLAHKIYAGSDIFLMPSQYEPCGLGQIIALRYGTIPVGRRTGGLVDTISVYNTKNGNGTGFLFNDYSPKALLAAVKEANRIFQDKKHWLMIQKNAMTQDFSWRQSAKQYLFLYEKALKKKSLSYDRKSG